MSERARVAVVGAGSWGTALAGVLAGNGHRTVLWALEPEVAAEVNASHTNAAYLPGATLPESLTATSRLAEALADAEVVVSVAPSQFVASVMAEAAPHLADDALVVSASKGIEINTLRRMDQVMDEVLTPAQRARFSVLSGPSFAAEVAEGAPTAVVAASGDADAARRVQRLFQNRQFRVYTNPDVIGVELGGALKNVVALGAGVAAGLGFGHNTRAALITRGLAEITRLGVAMGARRETFSGLAGMGDLVLTCTGDLSRNRTVGFRLGQGESLDEILGEMRAVAEGVKTAEAVAALAARHEVEMPIAAEVHAILTQGRSPREALDNLMSRDPKPEEWS
ncbi:MAG: NAD(P)H-dependent glycerol-3-phosphate dehydrogenase [Longimicrobiales bacterium]